MIRRLKLKNFKRHEDADFHFTEGLNGVFGKNYTGKTSMLYGILYALGGASCVPGTRIATRGASAGMVVELWLSVKGTEYYIKRTKSTCNLHQGDELIASGTTGVNEKIEELLGISMRRFRQLRYVEQKKSHASLAMGAAELHTLLDELTGMDTLTSALGKLKVMASSVKGAMAEVPVEDRSVEELESLLAEYESSIKALSERKDKISSGLYKEAVAEKSRLQATVSDLREIEQRYQKYQEQQGRLSEKAETLRSLCQSLETELGGMKVDSAILEEKRNELKQLRGQKESFTSTSAELGRLEAHRSRAEKQLSEAESSALSLRGRLERLEVPSEKEHQSIKEDCDRLREEVAATANEIRQLQHSIDSGVCKACKRPYDGVDTHGTEKRLAILEETLTDKKSRLSAAESKLSQANSIIKEFDKVEQSLRSAEKELHSTQEVVASLIADVQTCRIKLEGFDESGLSGISALEKEVQDLTSLQDSFQRIHSRYTASVAELETVEKRREALTPVEFSKPSLEAAEASLRQVDDQVSEYKEQLANLEAEIAGFQIRRSAAEKDFHRVSAYETRRRELEIRDSRIAALTKFLKANRDRFSASTWEYFLAFSSQFISSCTEGAIAEIRRTEEGKFVFLEDGFDMAVEEASGAQKAIMGLGVQLALSQAANSPFDVLLVDEPTADMDAEHSLASMSVMASVSQQVIAISHQQMDRSICSNTICL